MPLATPAQLFGLDLRSLAALRVGTGALILADLWTRGQSLQAHYSDRGILPRIVLWAQEDSDWLLSVHTMSGAWQIQAVLFVVAALFAFALLVGYRTRCATIVSWILLVSLQNRNPMILEGADVLLRLILFWGMFLPWGARQSFDAMTQRGRTPPGNQFLGTASFAYTIQIVVVYTFSALLKTGDEWRVEGTALYYALSCDIFAKPWAHALLQLPREWLEVATALVWWLEAVGMLLLFVPIKNAVFRIGVVACFVLLHLSIWLTLSVGLFPWIGSIAVIGLLPGQLWDKFPSLHSVPWAKRRAETLFEQLIVRPGLPADGTPVKLRESWLKRSLALSMLAYVLLWNMGTLEGSRIGTHNYYWIGMLLRVDQAWNMFAPYPYKDDGWYVIEGRLADDRVVDLFPFVMGRPPAQGVRWEKPRCVSRTFTTSRWQKYLSRLWQRDDRAHRQYLARFVDRRWNCEHSGPQRLEQLRIYYMLEVTRRYRTPEVERVAIWHYDCREGRAK